MSIGSILSGLTGTDHAAFSTRSATSSASQQLQTLFSKLHMDAIASAASTTGGTVAATTSTASSTSSGGAITDVAHGLRHILDGGISAAKELRTAAKTAASVYAGGGIGTIASQVLDKLG